MEMTDRSAGRYAMELHTRLADGTNGVRRWTEDLTAEEATARMGQVEAIPEVIALPSHAWCRLPGIVFEAYQDSGHTLTLRYRQTLDDLVAELPDGASLTLRRRAT